MSHRLVVQDQMLAAWAWARIGSQPPSSLCFGWRDDAGEPVGAVIIHRYTGKDGSAWVHWAGTPGWLTRGKIAAYEGYCFRQLQCRVIYGEVAEPDQYVRQLNERLGWRCVTRLPDAYPGGVAMCVYALTPDRAMTLKAGDGQEVRRAG